MEADRKRWNAKYQKGGGGDLAAPDAFFLEALAWEAPEPGRALDLAAGRGRHVLELARRGWRAEAWDVSDEALSLVESQARLEGLELDTRRVDLDEAFPIEQSGRYDLVVIVNFLDRTLLARVHELLGEGGRLLFATYTTDRSGSHPADDWCLAPGELAGGFEGFETLLESEQGGRAGWLGVRKTKIQ